MWGRMRYEMEYEVWDHRLATYGVVVFGRSAKFCTVNLWSAKDESRCATFLHHVKSAVEGEHA
jgi:hypothetical protein